jgi:hypothetical protein
MLSFKASKFLPCQSGARTARKKELYTSSLDCHFAPSRGSSFKMLQRSSLFFWFFLFLDRHVLQFTGLENVSTFLTFYIFRFFVAGDDLHPRMLAQFGADFSGRGLRRLARRHKLVDCSNLEEVCGFFDNWRYFAAASYGCQVPIGHS